MIILGKDPDGKMVNIKKERIGRFQILSFKTILFYLKTMSKTELENSYFVCLIDNKKGGLNGKNNNRTEL